MSAPAHRISGVALDSVESSVLVDAGYQSHVGTTILFPDRHIAYSQATRVLSGLTGTEEAIVLSAPAQDTGHGGLVSEGRAAGIAIGLRNEVRAPGLPGAARD